MINGSFENDYQYCWYIKWIEIYLEYYYNTWCNTWFDPDK